MGISLSDKSVKLFCSFDKSDIIITSPLGLRLALQSEEENKKSDYSYLSSIEILVIDRA